MQKMMGLVRRCIEDYNMIEAGDRVAVGVSGGKDSLTLLVVLAALREYYPIKFDLAALSVDMGLGGMDFSPVAELCARLNVPYLVKKTEIGPIIFDYRKEKNPCSMCAKMRRGALNDLMREQGYNKIALGHHYDDAVETFLMSLLYEGRISCFEPVTYLSRTSSSSETVSSMKPNSSRVRYASFSKLPISTGMPGQSSSYFSSNRIDNELSSASFPSK